MALYGNNNGYNSFNYGNSNPYINQGNPAQSYAMNNGMGAMGGGMNMNGYGNNGYYNNYQPNYSINGNGGMQSGGYSGYSADNTQPGVGKPIWVRGEMEAQMYPVHEPVWLMDSGSMTCYFKSPDMAEMKIYDMIERAPSLVQTMYPQISMDGDSQTSNKSQNNNNYVTWDALHQLENKVDEIMNSKMNQSVMPANNSNSNSNNNSSSRKNGGNNNG